VAGNPTNYENVLDGTPSSATQSLIHRTLHASESLPGDTDLWGGFGFGYRDTLVNVDLSFSQHVYDLFRRAGFSDHLPHPVLLTS